MTIAPLNHATPLRGPELPYDLHTTTETFAQLQQWIPQYGDVFPVTQKTRKAPALFVNDPDVIKHILIKNNKNYLKGWVSNASKCCWVMALSSVMVLSGAGNDA